MTCPTCTARGVDERHVHACHEVDLSRTAVLTAAETAHTRLPGVTDVQALDLWAHLRPLGHEEAARVVQTVLDLGWRPAKTAQPETPPVGDGYGTTDLIEHLAEGDGR